MADSVGHTASIRHVEFCSDSRIKTARAYSSVYDDRARWPTYNFTDVVKYELENPGFQNFDTLVMSAPTVDITNLDTSKLTTKDSTVVFQQNVHVSSKNMFSLAERSLQQNPNLSKVIIMEHPPRFDSLKVDPTSVKPTLAKLANNNLNQLWLNSSFKDRICIGHHSLENSGNGDVYKARYVNHIKGKSDGVHFYGPAGCTDYTDSVKSIMMLAALNTNPAKPKCGTAQPDKHENCPQAKYQERYTHQPSVVTQNRFSAFNQGN